MLLLPVALAPIRTSPIGMTDIEGPLLARDATVPSATQSLERAPARGAHLLDQRLAPDHDDLHHVWHSVLRVVSIIIKLRNSKHKRVGLILGGTTRSEILETRSAAPRHRTAVPAATAVTGDLFGVRDEVVGQHATYVRSFFTIRDLSTRHFIDGYLDRGALYPGQLVQLNASFEPEAPVEDWFRASAGDGWHSVVGTGSLR